MLKIRPHIYYDSYIVVVICISSLTEHLQVIIDTELGEFGSDGCLDFITTEYDRQVDDNHHKGKGM